MALKMSTLRRNILYNVGGQGLLMLLGLVAVRLVFRQLGADAFGIILFAQSMGLVLASVLELGISSTTVREVAAHAREESGYVWDLLRTATSIYWGAYIVVAGAAILGAGWLATHWLTLQSVDARDAARLMQILAVGVLLVLPRSLYGSLFRGLQRMQVTNAVEVGALTLQLLGTIAILTLHGDAFAVAWCLTAGYAASIVAYLLLAHRAGIPARALVPGFEPAIVRRNLRFALHMMSISALGTVHGQMDKLLVSKLMPVGALATYGFASTMVAGVLRLVSSIVQAAFPAFSELARQHDDATLLRRYHRVHTLIIFGAAPLFAGVVFGAEPILRYVFNGDVAQALMLPTVLLCVGSYLNASVSALYVISLAVGRPDIAARQNALALIVVPPIAVLSVWRFGLAGAGASWVFYHLFAYAYGVPRMCRECLGLSPRLWILGVARIMAVTVISYGPAYLLATALGGSVVVLAVVFVLGSLVYVGAGYLLLGRELRVAASQLRTGAAQPEAA
jgi:O-antigen/teichoic acid export membrane protein